MPKSPKGHNASLTLETTSTDSHFALAADLDFAALIAPLGTIPGGPYDYAFVSTDASVAGNISIGASLAALNGIIATGNGKDSIDLSNSTGANLVIAGNGTDTVIGGAGSENINGGNGKDSITGGADTGVFTVVVDTTIPTAPVTTTTFLVGDVLTGGLGKDQFHYALGDGVDEITDFRLHQDQLVFHGITQADLVAVTGTGSSSLVIGVSDGLGGTLANTAIQVDGVTSLDQLLNSGSLLFV
jgi:Ca2+-binding RTX toxin-like protein